MEDVVVSSDVVASSFVVVSSVVVVLLEVFSVDIALEDNSVEVGESFSTELFGVAVEVIGEVVVVVDVDAINTRKGKTKK